MRLRREGTDEERDMGGEMGKGMDERKERKFRDVGMWDVGCGMKKKSWTGVGQV